MLQAWLDELHSAGFRVSSGLISFFFAGLRVGCSGGSLFSRVSLRSMEGWFKV